MNRRWIIPCIAVTFLMGASLAQAGDEDNIHANALKGFKLSSVLAKDSTYKGKKVIEVTMPSELYQDPKNEVLTDRPNLAWLSVDFHNGVIECDVAAALSPDAPDYARGFIGIGFRIDSKLNFEGIYLRPANSRVEDQVRRNHSIQYFSLPNYDFAKFRKESPEKYESYADMGLGEWVHMKIEVRQDKARLYLNGMKQPSLVVNDLKLGPDQQGGVGFWLESGTIGYFRNLKITRDK
ncbi:MAG: hypothetical protein AB9872_04425 [Solidesulfovibrio sp.]